MTARNVILARIGVRFQNSAPIAPAPPENLRLTADPPAGGPVQLAWDAPSGGGPITSYELLRGGVVIASGITTQSTSDSTVQAGQSYSYTVRGVGPGGTGPASDALAVQVPQEQGSEVLARADFEDGTIGPYSMGGSADRTDWDVISDPTPRSQGRVLRLRYYAHSGGDPDCYASWSPPSNQGGAGQSVYSYGRFYIVPNGYSGNRKLWRYYVGQQGQSGSDITLWMGSTLRVEGPDGSRSLVFQNTDALTPMGTWHELEVQITLDSSAGARDGVFRVWLNRSLVYNNTTFQFTNANFQRLSIIRIGYQTQSTRNGLDDTRYWDDVTISTTRIAP